MTLKDEVVRLRESKGFTTNQLALVADVDQSSLSKMERGVRDFTEFVLDKIAPHLGVSGESLKHALAEEKSAKLKSKITGEVPSVLNVVIPASELPQPAPKQPASGALTPLAEYLISRKEGIPGMGYRDLARYLNIDERMLADILAGYLPPQKTLRKMAMRLGVKPENLYELAKPQARKLDLRDAIHELLVNRVQLPYYGQVGCGRVIMLSDHPEGTRSVPAYLLEGEELELISLVEATGDSMLNAKIWPGVTLIVRQQEFAVDGDVVIANIPHMGTTCKRLRVRRGGQWLESESPTKYEPIKVEDGVRITGKVLHAWYDQSFL
jgi:SOS-response transcriptional repressor LexA